MLYVSPTKRKIFYAAVDCFSEKSYRMCTMQDIAAPIGITAPSLYKHYKGKHEILDDILDYYYLNFNKHRTPICDLIKMADAAPIEKVISSMFFTFGTDEEKNTMIKISRIVMNMKCENKEVDKLYRAAFIDGSVEYLEMAFKMLIATKKLEHFDYSALAFQMVSFAHMLLIMSTMDNVEPKEIDRMFKEGIALYSRAFKCSDSFIAGERPALMYWS